MRSFILGVSLLALLRMDAAGADGFVGVSGRQFVLDGRPWYVCGTNLWYGAYLGRPSNPTGRARLIRELDRLEKGQSPEEIEKELPDLGEGGMGEEGLME